MMIARSLFAAWLVSGLQQQQQQPAAKRLWRRCTDEVDSRNYLIWSLKVIDINRTIILPLLILFHFLAHLHPYAPHYQLNAQRSTAAIYNEQRQYSKTSGSSSESETDRHDDGLGNRLA